MVYITDEFGTILSFAIAQNIFTMKSTKQSLFVLAATFAATASFAQVNLGVTNTTNALQFKISK